MADPTLNRTLAAALTRAWTCARITPLALVLLAGLPAALAQPAESQPATQPAADPATDPPALDTFESRPIRRIVLRVPIPDSDPPAYAPLTGPSRQLAENQIRSVAGTPLRTETVTRDLARLNRVGRFDQITSGAALLSDGSVDLIFTLTLHTIIEDVQVIGNARVKTSEIAVVVDLLKGSPVDRYQLDRATRTIEALYQAKGYAFIHVGWELIDDGIVLFRINEGSRLKVTDVRFEFQSTRSFTPAELKKAIETKTATLLNRGRLDLDILDRDVSALIEFYRDHGYIDARVDRAAPTLSPNGREAIVTFIIDEGSLYTLRSVQVFYPDLVRDTFPTRARAQADAQRGEEVVAAPTGGGTVVYVVFRPAPYSSEQIAGLMALKRGDVYAADKLELSMRRVAQALGKLGYQGIRVDSARLSSSELRDPNDPRQIDLLVTIRPGSPVLTGEVIIIGNDITRQKVIRRDLFIRPERPLDTTALENSRRQLIQSNLYGGRRRDSIPPKLTVLPADPDFPGYRDVIVEIEETVTGSFNIGGLINSDAGATARVAITQRNFDITDFPDTVGELFSQRAFRGGGQTFRLEALPGTQIQTYLISLSEPAIFDTDYTGSVTASFRNRIFRQYDEERVSLRLALGRRFGRQWTGLVQARIEQIDISDIDEDGALDIFDVEGESMISGLTLQLTRNTLDSRIRPGKGMRTTLAIEQVGAFGGDYTFTKFRIENVIYATLHRDFLGRKTVVSLNTEVAYIPQGEGEAPVFERFFRGGQSFRAFDFRGIAPIGIRADTGGPTTETIGGTFEAFLGIQIEQPLFEDIVSVVFFIDSGTVSNDVNFDSYRVSIGSGLRLITPLSPAPIALDFGFPILSEESDAERVFTFTIDLPF